MATRVFRANSGHERMTGALQALARRYGKKKKRIYRLSAASVRPAINGALGEAQRPGGVA